MQNSLHPLSTSFIIAHHLLDFTVQGKITEGDVPTVCPDTTLDSMPHNSIAPIFILYALFATTLPIFPVLE